MPCMLCAHWEPDEDDTIGEFGQRPGTCTKKDEPRNGRDASCDDDFEAK